MSDQTGTYLLGCQEFLKIGYTSVGVHMRIKAMQTGNPFTLHPLAIVPRIVLELARDKRGVGTYEFANEVGRKTVHKIAVGFAEFEVAWL